MIHKILFFTILLTSFFSTAQTININPDKSGEPWLVGGLRLPSQAELAQIPVLEIPVAYKSGKRSLPTSLDNSTNAYFRPIFNQAHGSCSQASGVGYTFTYEMNLMRGTSANIPANQFPSHYTYNFLNDGSGDNGSWYMDGWDIIKANGCPTVPTYGGMAGSATKWMSGYGNYESSMENRVKDYFVIQVGTPSGLDNLKYWMLDHLNGNATGGIVNFAAGVTGEFHMTNNKIVEWGHTVNHAMTIVGWDDTVEYDYNNDGTITNTIDINGDGVVDMKDWERGALIMVNSWGTGFGNGGKAYMMYKTLAEPASNGGIYYHHVYGIRVKEAPEPQLKMKIKMTHNSRKRIKLFPGISSDLSDEHPDEVMLLPMFSMQGGDNHMQGNNTQPIEISLDISPLLSYIQPNQTAKVFLVVQEVDMNNESSGEIIDFSIVDNAGNEYTYTPHNKPINDNGFTFLSINAALDFEFPSIQTTSLPNAEVGVPYSKQLTASGGTAPYTWELLQNYSEESLSEAYPNITTTKLTPNNNDDGYATQTLDFEFPFYGETYNELYITTDGSISFEPTFKYIRSENAIIGNRVISVFAHDLLIENSNHGIYYEGDSNSATFRWKETLYGNTSANVDVAATLYPDGTIDYFYGSGITADLSWAAGISNGDGSYEITSISGVSNPSDEQLKMKMQAFPIGMSIDNNGLFNGTVSEEGSWDLTFKATDEALISGIKVLNLSTTAASVQEVELFTFNVFPNPAKNSVNITYSLLQNSDMNLAIYDINGRLIETLIDGRKEAGNHQATWNSKIHSGLFIFKIRSDNQIKSGLIIVE